MIGITHDKSAVFSLKANFLAGLGGLAVTSALRLPAAAQSRPSLSLRLRPGTTKLGADLPDSPVWVLDAGSPGSILRFKRNDELQVAFANEISVPAALSWAGIDGVQATTPLVAQGAVMAGGRANLAVPLRHAGTFLVEASLLGNGKDLPSPACALIVDETEKVAVDRDEVLLIQDWRVRSDGRAIAPGVPAQDTTVAYTVNGRPNLDLTVKANERLRLRFISGCPRAPIGLKVENLDVRIMAIDGQPAEPFAARDGQVVLPPRFARRCLRRCHGGAGHQLVDHASRRNGPETHRAAHHLEGCPASPGTAAGSRTIAVQWFTRTP